MKVANIAKTRNQLSQLLRRVKRGETVIITDRDRPVARLTPIDMAAAPSASELDTLFASGALLPFVGSPLDVDAFLAAPRAVMRADASLTAAVLSERQEGAMRFWDSSALGALLVDEADSHRRAEQLRKDPVIAVWWATPVECESAIQRHQRDGTLFAAGARQARERLAELASAWHEAPPQPGLRTLAVRLLRTHPLRAADALQLAAALTLCTALGRQIEFVCADDRLASAAEIENLPVVR